MDTTLLGAGCAGRDGRSQPADNHDCGIENCDHPQSRHTDMSGEGVTGGWLSVRGPLRYSRISAGTVDRALDWHLGQATIYLRRVSDFISCKAVEWMIG